MYIVIDSNIWLSELGLNSSKGSAVRFFIKEKKAKLALPEVIKEEVERNISNKLSAIAKGIQKNHRQLLTVFGQLKEITLPTEKEIKERSSSIFDDMKIEIHHISFSLEGAKSSLNKINSKLPPSDKNQQFKDGVIWYDSVSLLEKEDVYLITKDKAFFKDKTYEKGLSENLKKETELYKNKLTIYSSSTDLLHDIKTDISINEDELLNKIYKEAEASTEVILQDAQFSLSSGRSIEISAFITESPGVIYISYIAKFNCIDLTEEGREEGMLIIRGDVNYNPEDKVFNGLRYGKIDLSYDYNGQNVLKSSRLFFGGYACYGNQTINHRVRFKV